MVQPGGRGTSQSSRGHDAHCYAFLGRPNAEASDVVISRIVSICYWLTSLWFELGSTYSYMPTYFSAGFDLLRDCMSMLVYVSTQVGELLVMHQLYQSRFFFYEKGIFRSLYHHQLIIP